MNNRWTCKGLPEFRIRPSRTLPEGKPVAARITRSGRRVLVCFVYEVEKTALPPTGCAVGLDMGVANEETGAALSGRDCLMKRPLAGASAQRRQPLGW